MAPRPCRVSASRSRPCPRPLQGGGSARRTTALPRGESRHRRLDAVSDVRRGLHGRAPWDRNPHGPRPAVSWRRRLTRKSGQAGLGRAATPRGRARPRPLRAAGRPPTIALAAFTSGAVSSLARCRRLGVSSERWVMRAPGAHGRDPASRSHDSDRPCQGPHAP
jgi:hypothetical protein